MSCGTKSGEFKAITAAQAAEAAKAASSANPAETAEPAAPAKPPAEPELDQPTEPLPVSAGGGLFEDQEPEPEPVVARPRAASPPPPVSTAPRSAPSGGGSGRGAGTWVAVAAAGAALAAVVIVLAVVLSGSDPAAENASAAGGNDEQVAAVDDGREYQEQVAEVFGPVLGAQQKLSTQLEALRADRPRNALRAVRQVTLASTEARGALKALKAPDAETELARNAQEVLTRQEAYLSAVKNVLDNPSVSAASQLVTLSSNLSSSLTAAGPGVAGEEEVVTAASATRLTSWARTTARVRREKEKDKDADEQENDGNGSGGGSGSASSAPRGTSCGGGLYAGPNTSCEFARNVREAYWEAPGSAATIRVHSPVTGETYTMNCSPSGNGITCSGGNNASVTF